MAQSPSCLIQILLLRSRFLNLLPVECGMTSLCTVFVVPHAVSCSPCMLKRGTEVVDIGNLKTGLLFVKTSDAEKSRVQDTTIHRYV